MMSARELNIGPPGQELAFVGVGEFEQDVRVAGRLDGGQGGESSHPRKGRRSFTIGQTMHRVQWQPALWRDTVSHSDSKSVPFTRRFP